MRIKSLILSVMFIVLLSSAGLAQSPAVPAKAAAHAVKKGATVTASSTKKAGKATAKATKKAGKFFFTKLP